MKRVLMLLVGLVLAGASVRTLSAQQPDGQAIFREECKSCHGINGVPPEQERTKYRKLRSLGDSGFVLRLSQDSIVAILTHGIDTNMKSFKERLSVDEMRAVATYIHALAARRHPA